jgi:hypothetical protein
MGVKERKTYNLDSGVVKKFEIFRANGANSRTIHCQR